MSNLQQRVITGVIAAPLMVGAVLFLPGTPFAVLLALFILVGAWEWSGFLGWRTPAARWTYLVATLLALLGVALLVSRYSAGWPVLLVAAVWWLLALSMVWRYQGGGSMPGAGRRLPHALNGWLVLLPAWAALVLLHGWDEFGPWRVLFLLALVWGADIAAYFSGRRWGSDKLASRVSPGKTREGAYGALAAGAVLGVAGFALGGGGAPVLLAMMVLIGVLTVAVCILGDLLESLYKREAGLKDSGSLFPGHGGVLDRIDSLTAAAPVFAGGQYLLEALA